jgi:S-layer domain
LTVSSSDIEFRASEDATLNVNVINNGELLDGGRVEFENEVKTAKSVQISIDEDAIDAPIEVNTGTQSLGRLVDGDQQTVGFDLEIGAAQPGTYEIPVEVTYQHPRVIAYGQFEDTDRQNREQTVSETIEIRIEDRPEFELTATEQTTVVAGDTRQVSYELVNTGTQTARDATVRLETQTPGVFFGKQTSQSTTTSVFVSELSAGDSHAFRLQMGAGPDVAGGTYTVAAGVEYENQNGVARTSDPLSTGVTVASERNFALESMSLTDFRVDESEARIEATISNEGPVPANNVVVRIGETSAVSVVNGESAVGDLTVGDSAPVSFTVAIPNEAEPGSISMPFSVEYENADGDIQTLSTPLRKPLEIQPEQDRFEIVGVNTSVTPGGAATLDVQLRHTGSEPVSNANARLFTNDPLSSSDDGAFLGEIGPGETVTAQFRVSASGDALPKSYGSSVEVRYDEADGDTRFTGSLSAGIPVSDSEGGGLPLLPVGIGAIVLLGGGAVVYRRF